MSNLLVHQCLRDILLFVCVYAGQSHTHRHGQRLVTHQSSAEAGRKTNIEKAWDWISGDFRTRREEWKRARMRMEVYREPKDPEGEGKCV